MEKAIYGEKTPVQLPLFPEISGTEGHWLEFPYDWRDPIAELLRSFAGRMLSVSHDSHHSRSKFSALGGVRS